MADIVLITGGVRSGKSTYALTLARQAAESVAFVATAEASDDEMRERIARHKIDRPAQWLTIEEPYELGTALARAASMAQTVVVDDLTVWVSNRLLQSCGDPNTAHWYQQLYALEQQLIAEWTAAVSRFPTDRVLIAVSAETGWGVVPATPLGRAFRDILGRLNQYVAAHAQHVYLLVAGIPIDVKHLHAATHRASEENFATPKVADMPLDSVE